MKKIKYDITLSTFLQKIRFQFFSKILSPVKPICTKVVLQQYSVHIKDNYTPIKKLKIKVYVKFIKFQNLITLQNCWV